MPPLEHPQKSVLCSRMVKRYNKRPRVLSLGHCYMLTQFYKGCAMYAVGVRPGVADGPTDCLPFETIHIFEPDQHPLCGCQYQHILFNGCLEFQKLRRFGIVSLFSLLNQLRGVSGGVTDTRGMRHPAIVGNPGSIEGVKPLFLALHFPLERNILIQPLLGDLRRPFGFLRFRCQSRSSFRSPCCLSRQSC